MPKGLSVIFHKGTLLAKLYNTVIVEYIPADNRLILRTGGWFTPHTKKCINLVLADYGFRVVQSKKQWYVYSGTEIIGLFNNDTWANDFKAA